MIDRVRETIRRYGMFRSGDTVCVAVSGGVDSTVLLDILVRLSGELSLDLVVCHLNHGLRGEESARDEGFVRGLAEDLGLVFEAGRLDPREAADRRRESVQEWARKRRMAFLEGAARRYGATRIALGHNRDDQAETVLMRMIRGSALKGLGGMAPSCGRLVRPLIEVSREEIERYARERGLAHVEDSSNSSTKYLRNRIRHEIVPFLQKGYNPNINETLARSASVLRRDEDFLEREAERAFEEVVTASDHGAVSLDRKRLLALHDAISSRVFLSALRKLEGAAPAHVYTPQVETFFNLLRSERPNLTVKLREGLYLKREYDALVLAAGSPEEKEWTDLDREIKVPGITEVPELGLRLSTEVLRYRPRSLKVGAGTAYFDFESVSEPLLLRTFRPGDRMRPLGMKGSKKLKDIFIDAKIPLSDRRGVPLLVSGGRIIWAVGVRQSEYSKVADGTKRVLRVDVMKYTGW